VRECVCECVCVCVCVCVVEVAGVTVLHEEHSPNWVTKYTVTHFLQDGSGFLWASEASGYRCACTH